MTLVELKDIARRLGVSQQGRKAQILTRIMKIQRYGGARTPNPLMQRSSEQDWLCAQRDAYTRLSYTDTLHYLEDLLGDYSRTAHTVIRKRDDLLRMVQQSATSSDQEERDWALDFKRHAISECAALLLYTSPGDDLSYLLFTKHGDGQPLYVRGMRCHLVNMISRVHMLAPASSVTVFRTIGLENRKNPQLSLRVGAITSTTLRKPSDEVPYPEEYACYMFVYHLNRSHPALLVLDGKGRLNSLAEVLLAPSCTFKELSSETPPPGWAGKFVLE